MHFRGDADGVHLVGDWEREHAFSPELLGDPVALEHKLVRTTIKIQTVDGWALYRVTGTTQRRVPELANIQARLVRRGRGKGA